MACAATAGPLSGPALVGSDSAVETISARVVLSIACLCGVVALTSALPLVLGRLIQGSGRDLNLAYPQSAVSYSRQKRTASAP